jgi:hypothetical protein
VLQLGIVTATTAYDADGRPVPLVLSEESVTEGVARSASFQLNFDRFLLPPRVIRQAVCLRPSTEEVATFEGCIDPLQEFTEPEYNPVRRQVTFRLPPGARLAADTLYRLTVFASAEPDVPTFLAFDGAPLVRSYSFQFRTQPSGGAERDEPLPTRERYCAAVQCFDACPPDDALCAAACNPQCIEPTCFNRGAVHRQPGAGIFRSCIGGGCHRSDASSSSSVSMDLDLVSEQALVETAIGQTAHQTHTGEAAETPDRGGVRFGHAMPLIDPANPGNSYLLYKVIVNPLNYLRPGGGFDIEPQLAAEIQRLREAVVVGLPMPVDGQAMGDDGGTLDVEGVESYRMLEALNAWIAHGAPISCP